MKRLLLIGIVLLGALHVAVLAYHLSAIVAFPYDLEYGEGYVLNDAVRLSRGEAVYGDVQQFPMIRSPYPPLFPLIWSALIPIAGPAFWVGRLLSLAALVVIGALVAWNGWRACRSPWPAVVSVGVLAASPFVYQWAGYARVDLTALMFATAGVLAAQWVGGWRGVLGAAALCGLALWTKQTTLTAALAVAFAFALRDWRHGVAFVAAVGVPSAVLALAMNGLTDGEFSRHVLAGNATNPFFVERAGVYMGTFLLLHLVLVAAGVWWLSRAWRGVPSPIALYLPISLLGALSAGNGGSSVNYLLEPLIALCLALPLAWRSLPRGAAVLGPLLACTQLVVLVHWPNSFGTRYLGDFGLGHTPTAHDSSIGAQLDSLVRSESGEILAEPAGFAVRNGRTVYVQPIDLRAEELQGRWRSGDLVAALDGGRFALVITSYNFLPLAAERAVERHFAAIESLPGPGALTYQVYRFELRTGEHKPAERL